MNKTINIAGVVVGVLLVLLAFVYWSTPAGLLPAFLPGHEAGSLTIHFKHGLASFILGLAAFVFVWFRTGRKGTGAPPQN